MSFDQMPNSQFGVESASHTRVNQGLRSYMLRVYNYMAAGLLLTGVVAYLVLSSSIMDYLAQEVTVEGVDVLKPTLLGYAAIFAPLVMLFITSFRAHKMSAASVQLFYWAYTGLSGVGFGYLLWMYLSAGLHTPMSVATVFFITASAFLGLSIVGYTTKKDLSGMGRFLTMAVIGLIVAGIANMFMGSSLMAFGINVAAVLIFAGLTAYDTQEIKQQYYMLQSQEDASKSAIFGALKLYIDFMAMFQALLSLLSNRD